MNISCFYLKVVGITYFLIDTKKVSHLFLLISPMWSSTESSSVGGDSEIAGSLTSPIKDKGGQRQEGGEVVPSDDKEL